MAEQAGGEPNSLEDGYSPWEEFTAKVDEAVKQSAVPGKHAARSAIRHMQRAIAIKDIDPEGAVLHAITAEEEAATAIFHALRRRKYAGAELLDRKRHEHKAAVIPFFKAVAAFAAEIEAGGIKVRPAFPNKGEDRRLKIIVYPEFLGDNTALFPVPPLHGAVTLGNQQHDFGEELQTWAQRSGGKSVLDAIRERVKERRVEIWYAGQGGIPSVTIPLDGFLTKTRDAMYGQLAVFLLIDQYPERQGFVQQALDAFLKIIPPHRSPGNNSASPPPASPQPAT